MGDSWGSLDHSPPPSSAPRRLLARWAGRHVLSSRPPCVSLDRRLRRPRARPLDLRRGRHGRRDPCASSRCRSLPLRGRPVAQGDPPALRARRSDLRLKLPRDLSGAELAQALQKVGYRVTRQTGSHKRLTTSEGGEHHLTIPAHDALRIGTLAGILGDMAGYTLRPRSGVVSTSARDRRPQEAKGPPRMPLLQGLQRGELPLVERGEALGFRSAHGAASYSAVSRCFTMPMISSARERIRPSAAGR
jgi:predicted RNA binding protein YcfA (HicA-like mRNA interferase family)